jgi:hypothetical protein
MLFKDIWQEAPVQTLIWVIPKYMAQDNTPKLAVITTSAAGVRRISNGDRACDYLFGDTVAVPTVELISQGDSHVPGL